MSRSRWAALVLGLLFGALAIAQSVVGQSVVLAGAAVVTEIKGPVEVQIGTEAPRPLKPGQSIPPGAIVFTGEDASAVLAFADGQMVVLGERTTFRIVNYNFDPKELKQSGVFLNLVEGSARLVMGAIGQFDPRLVRIQVGTGTLTGALNPDGGNAADAGVVVQGSNTLVTVTQGRVNLTLPNGQSIPVASGQGAYVQADGAVQRGSAAELSSQLGATAYGKQILEQLVALQAFVFPPLEERTVITLATGEAATTAGLVDLPTEPTEAVEPQIPPLATTTSTTSATAAGGGACGASCN